jgi:hypothetical protein
VAPGVWWETAAHLVDHVIPRVPVRQWVLSFPIPLRVLFAAHPELLTPVLQIVHRVISGFLLKQAGLKRAEAATGAVTLIQRFGSAANLNIPIHGLVLDGVFRLTAGGPEFHPVRAPTVAPLQTLLTPLIKRLMRLLTRQGCTPLANERDLRSADRSIIDAVVTKVIRGPQKIPFALRYRRVNGSHPNDFVAFILRYLSTERVVKAHL